MSMSGMAVLIFLSVAAGTDLCDGRIYNQWLGPGAVTAFVLLAAEGGMGELPDRILGGTIPILILMLPFAVGALGGGDVKLLAMTGCFVGCRGIFSCMLGAFVAGAALAAWKMLWARSFWERLRRLKAYLAGCLLSRKLSPYPASGRREEELHFSLPVLFGVWLYLEGVL